MSDIARIPQLPLPESEQQMLVADDLALVCLASAPANTVEELQQGDESLDAMGPFAPEKKKETTLEQDLEFLHDEMQRERAKDDMIAHLEATCEKQRAMISALEYQWKRARELQAADDVCIGILHKQVDLMQRLLDHNTQKVQEIEPQLRSHE